MLVERLIAFNRGIDIEPTYDGKRVHQIDLRLLKAVPHHTRDTLHTKLAEVYMLNGKLDDALESFHFAIRYSTSIYLSAHCYLRKCAGSCLIQCKIALLFCSSTAFGFVGNLGMFNGLGLAVSPLGP